MYDVPLDDLLGHRNSTVRRYAQLLQDQMAFSGDYSTKGKRLRDLLNHENKDVRIATFDLAQKLVFVRTAEESAYLCYDSPRPV